MSPAATSLPACRLPKPLPHTAGWGRKFVRSWVLALGLGALNAGTALAQSEASAVSQWPAAAKEWLPWALQGQEQLLCPRLHEDANQRACVWPGQLSLKAHAQGAGFSMSVRVYGAATWVELPGEAAAWPQEVRVNGKPVAVTAHEGQPALWLAAGVHQVEGEISWAAMPQDLRLPAGLAVLDLSVDGRTERRAASNGRVWLRQSAQEARAADALTVRTLRRLDDGIPMDMRTRFELTVAGRAREVELPLAVLPGWVARGIDSALPVRLQEDGRIKLQARPGQWSVEIHSQHMTPLSKLELPAGGASAEEVWVFEAHNELRLLSLEGPSSVDPKQVEMPDDWRSLPAYRLKPGEPLKLLESRRGNANPGPDALELRRTLWLDFDGQGYTAQDQLSGRLARATRLDMAAPGVLGRASSDGQDQTISRLSAQSPAGLALRSEQVQVEADSRIEGPLRSLSASGWLADFNRASTTLNLPPGWRLLHASGPDRAQGAWTARWTLWDFFFVLLTALAAGKLLGWRSGALVGAALVLGWHMGGTPPRWLWLALIGGLALVRVLPGEVGRQRLRWASQSLALVIGLCLLPYALDQVRLSMYPSLEMEGMGEGVSRVAQGDEAPPEVAMAAKVGRRAMSEASERIAYSMVPSPEMAPLPEGVDPRARVQTGPGLPRWSWHSHELSWQGPVQKNENLRLWLLPPWGTALLRLGSLLLMAAALWQLVRLGGLWPPAGTPGRSGAEGGSSESGPHAPADAAGPQGGASDGASGEASGSASGGALSSSTASLAALFGAIGLFAASLAPQPAWAGKAPAEPAAATTTVTVPASPSLPWPNTQLLEELRQRALPAPACMPQCVDVARAWVSAKGSQISLRLALHAQASVAVPLPASGSNWLPHQISLEGKPATLRRDEAGDVWVVVPQGVSQLLLEADAGDNASVDIHLPLPVREVKASLDGWTLSGLDARGLASGALMLAREVSRSNAQDRSTERDSLPPLVRVRRSLSLGLSWQMSTTLERISASRAPVQVQYRLLAGESVTDESVKVEDGVATVQLGQQERLLIQSQLQPLNTLQWVSSDSARQVEEWSMSASPQWQALLGEAQGIAPIWHFVDGRWNPHWQPWPGEKLTLGIVKPLGVEGQTFTIDQLGTTLTPGGGATDVRSQLELRSSLGGNHRLQFPNGAELRGVALNGRTLPLRLEAGALSVPIPPGAHQLSLDWRLPEGMGTLLKSPSLQPGSPGVNERLTIHVPQDRIALAMGGPLMGPAVLFWGTLVVVLAIALALSRLKAMPLGGVAWALLGLGLAPVNVWGLALLLGWFLALHRRAQWAKAEPTGSAAGLPQRRWVFNGMQLLLIWGAVLVAGVLLHALQVGLLGYPDLMIAGNGSTARELHWFADRFGTTSNQAWVLSMPLWLYRVLMLLWALWLASALLGWLRWAWEAFSAGGVWRGKPSPDKA